MFVVAPFAAQLVAGAARLGGGALKKDDNLSLLLSYLKFHSYQP